MPNDITEINFFRIPAAAGRGSTPAVQPSRMGGTPRPVGPARAGGWSVGWAAE
ncbi:hypothetical protein ACWDWO_02185 [Actinopolymorpha singaporensis]